MRVTIKPTLNIDISEAVTPIKKAVVRELKSQTEALKADAIERAKRLKIGEMAQNIADSAIETIYLELEDSGELKAVIQESIRKYISSDDAWGAALQKHVRVALDDVLTAHLKQQMQKVAFEAIAKTKIDKVIYDKLDEFLRS
jgi:rRNA maturation endonuclease Nob1